VQHADTTNNYLVMVSPDDDRTNRQRFLMRC